MLGCTSTRGPERRLAAAPPWVWNRSYRTYHGHLRNDALMHWRHGRVRVARPHQTRMKCKDKRHSALRSTNSGLASQR
jgi:hypothetical protein